MYGIMTKISSVSSQNQLLMFKNAPEFTRRCMDKKKFSTFSYKLVQISPIVILVNSGAFLSISSWFCKLTELIFVMIPYISYTGYPPQNARDYGSCASSEWHDFFFLPFNLINPSNYLS